MGKVLPKQMTEAELNLKKENSYTYWVDKEKEYYKNIEKPSTEPKMIEKHEALLSNSSHNNISAWNPSGTWEEKTYDIEKISEFLKTEIKSQIVGNLEIVDLKN